MNELAEEKESLQRKDDLNIERFLPEQKKSSWYSHPRKLDGLLRIHLLLVVDRVRLFDQSPETNKLISQIRPDDDVESPIAAVHLHHLQLQFDLFQLALCQSDSKDKKQKDVDAQHQRGEKSLDQDTMKSLTVENESTQKSKEAHQKGNTFQDVQVTQVLTEGVKMRLQKESDDKDCHHEKALEIAPESVGKDDDDGQDGFSEEDQTIPVVVFLLEYNEKESHRLLRPLGRQFVLCAGAFQQNSQQKWKQNREEQQRNGCGKSEGQMTAAEALHGRVCDPVAMCRVDVSEEDAIVHVDTVECIDGDLHQCQIGVVADDNVGQDNSSEESVPVLVPPELSQKKKRGYDKGDDLR